MRSFGSDNHSGVHPEILQAIQNANTDHAPSYGTDAWSERALALIKKNFGEDKKVTEADMGGLECGKCHY